MRLLALRLVIGWWMIPLVWIVVWPIIFLMVGNKISATLCCSEISRVAWNGFPKEF